MFTRAKLFLSRHFKQLFYGFNEVRRVQLFFFFVCLFLRVCFWVEGIFSGNFASEIEFYIWFE